MRTSSVLAAFALAGGSVLAAAPAHAAPTPVPGCGAVLTTDSRLVADLTCPAGGGLVLAGGVTLDLRGHTLASTSGGTAILLPSLGDVTIRNGTVTGWDVGVQTFDPSEEVGGTATIRKVVFRDNGTGVDTSGRPGSTGKEHEISRSTFTGNGSGVSGIFGGAHVVRSTFRGNGTGLDFITGGFHLEDSLLEGNSTGVNCDESGCLVERSRIIDNGAGFDVQIYGADVYDSTLEGNDTAFYSFNVSRDSSLERNTFTGNGTAVELEWSSATLIENTFRGNDVAFTSDEGDPEWPSSTLTGNQFVGNGDGILAGFDTSLQDNTAQDNERWGIYAPGAWDLGGNQASGNGNEPQCVGVVCEERS